MFKSHKCHHLLIKGIKLILLQGRNNKSNFNFRWDSPQTPEDLQLDEHGSHPPPADV